LFLSVTFETHSLQKYDVGYNIGKCDSIIKLSLGDSIWRACPSKEGIQVVSPPSRFAPSRFAPKTTEGKLSNIIYFPYRFTAWTFLVTLQQL
jgi:hypothetical protein